MNENELKMTTALRQVPRAREERAARWKGTPAA